MIEMVNRFFKKGLFMALGLLMLLPAPGRAEVRQVLVIPFQMHSETDLSFLRKGITAMLSSRLTDMGKVVVIDQTAAAEILRGLPSPLTREAAAEAGRKFYMTEDPCKGCGDYVRYTSSAQCVTCTKTRANARQGAIRGKLRAARG